METPTTPIQELDAVLYVTSLSFEKEITEIRAYLSVNYKIDFTEGQIRRILIRLQKDGYVEFYSHANLTRISFDGEVFLSQGGYMAKSLADAANAEEQQLEIARLKSVDASSDLNQKTLNKLTNRLSWATWFAFIAAMALLGWSIYTYYHPASIPANVNIGE